MTYDVLSSSLHSLVKVAMLYRLHRPGSNLAVVVVQVPFIEYLRRYFSWSKFLRLEVLDFYFSDLVRNTDQIRLDHSLIRFSSRI